MPRIRHDKTDPAVVATRALQFDPGVIDIFGASVAQGFRDFNSITGLFETLDMAPGRQFTEEEMRRFGLSESEITNELEYNKINRTLTQEEWEASPHAREGKEWFEGITESQAKMMADRVDRKEEEAFIQSRAKGFFENSAIFVGNLIGSIPDPINFIPFLGVAARGVMAAKLGRVAGAATVGAVEAGVATALVQPLFALRAKSFQERYDLEMAATDVGMALLVGAGFGSIAGAIGRTSDALKATATAKAAQDLIDGKPVDVNRALGDIVDGTPLIREGMNFEGPTGARGPLLERMGAADNRLRAEEVLLAAMKPRNQRTARDALLLRSLDLSPEARAAVRIARKPGALRTAEEKFTLDAFRKGKETELIEGKLKKVQAEKRMLERELNRLRPAGRKQPTAVVFTKDGALQPLTATDDVFIFADRLGIGNIRSRYDAIRAHAFGDKIPSGKSLKIKTEVSRKRKKGKIGSMGETTFHPDGGFDLGFQADIGLTPREFDEVLIHEMVHLELFKRDPKLARSRGGHPPEFVKRAKELERMFGLSSAVSKTKIGLAFIDERTRGKILGAKNAERDALLRERLRDLKEQRPLDATVAARAVSEPLEVEPTTPKNARALPDVDEGEAAELTRRVAELEEAEGLLPDERKLLEDSIEFEARANKYDEAYEDAAACLAQGVA